MTPAEYGRQLALAAPPISDETAERAAHIFVAAERAKAERGAA